MSNVWPGAVEDSGYHQPRLRKAVDGFVGMKVGMGEIERHYDTALVRLGIRRGLSAWPPDSYSSTIMVESLDRNAGDEKEDWSVCSITWT